MNKNTILAMGPGVVTGSLSEPLFIDFGKFSTPTGAQQFDLDAATKVRDNFYRLRPASGLEGVPIYAGFPNIPKRPDSNPSAPALGWLDDMSLEDGRLRVSLKWNNRGQASLGDYRFYVPTWLAASAAGTIHPVKLVSINLTNRPPVLIRGAGVENDRSAAGLSSSKARAKAVAAEAASISKTLPAETRYSAAWNRAARKNPDLF